MLPDPALLLAVAAVALLHRRGARAEGPAGRATSSVGRLDGWAAPLGLLVVVAALLPRLEAAAEQSFAWHMVQHQLLLLVAAPLIGADAPVRRAWRGATGRAPGATAPGDAGAWALAGGVVAVAVLLAWHFPPLYDAAMADARVHLVEHATLLGSGVALWAAVLRAGGGGPARRAAADDRRLGAAVVTLAGTAIVGAGLGVVLLTAPRPFYDAYLEGGSVAITQQQVGGALMKVGALLVHAGAAVGLTLRWLHRLARTPTATGQVR